MIPGVGERRHLHYATLYLAFVFLVGVAGLRALEGKSLVDAVYLTVVSLTTVGLGGGVDRMGDAGRLLTIFIILNGVGVASYVIGVIAKMIVGGELRQILGQSYMQHKIRSMEGHVVICGCSDSTPAITREFEEAGSAFVIIDADPAKVEALLKRDIPAVHGDASREEVLLEAGVARARALVANLPHDAENVFIVLTARTLRPDLFIVTRANAAENVEKMRKVGADRVISPAVIGARRMAAYVLKRSVVDFMDVVVRGSGVELRMESVTVEAGAEVAGRSIRDADIRARTGVAVVAIQHDESFFMNPEPHTVLEAGDTLIVMGSAEGLATLRRMTGGG